MSAEFWAIIGIGIALFGQGVMQDGRINRINDRIDRLGDSLRAEIRAVDTKLSAEIKALDNKLSAEIKALDNKVDDIDKRLYVVESHLLGAAAVAQADVEPAI